jgi:hypothetical protein
MVPKLACFLQPVIHLFLSAAPLVHPLHHLPLLMLCHLQAQVYDRLMLARQLLQPSEVTFLRAVRAWENVKLRQRFAGSAAAADVYRKATALEALVSLLPAARCWAGAVACLWRLQHVWWSGISRCDVIKPSSTNWSPSTSSTSLMCIAAYCCHGLAFTLMC